MQRIILHIDVNSAFLSWEAIHRLENAEPDEEITDLRDIVSIVGGDEAKRRGVVLAKSEKAKKYGIHTGESLFAARKKCPSVTIVKPSHNLYRKYSDKLYNLLTEYTEKVERYSIDECFVDYTDAFALHGDAIEFAKMLSCRIKNELGFTVNIGISSNKFLAKMAGELEKPNKIITLFPEEMEEKMYPLEIREMFMVGRKTKEKLNRIGVYTIADLAEKDIDFLRKFFKDAMGTMLYNYSHGIDDSKVDYNPKHSKSVGNSMTLSEDIHKIDDIRKVLMSLSESVGTRLRKKKLRGNIIHVTIKTSTFEVYSHQRKYPQNINSTTKIFENALALFEEFYKGEPIRLLGVSVGNLTEDLAQQMTLFDNEEKDKKVDGLERTIDDIRDKFGAEAIKKGNFVKGKIKNVSDKMDFYK